MKEEDRQQIDDFNNVLIEKTNFKKVYTLLLRWKIIRVNAKAFQDLTKSDQEMNKILYQYIQTMGKHAFPKLVLALRLSNPELAEQFEGHPWRISNEQWICSPQGYNLSDAKIRGSYRVVTMTANRTGWETEVKNFEETFKFLHYEGSKFEDPTEEEFNNLLTDFTEDVSGAGCYVFALSGHGHLSKGEEMILQPNKSYKEVNKIVSKIAKAPRLLNKPKIIILQICRGDKETLPSSDRSLQTPVEIPDIKDTIILRPSLPGYAAYRDIYLGGWFIDVLTKMIRTYARHKDVEEIMIEVHAKLSEMRQNRTGFHENFSEWRYMTPCTNAYSFKKFYFLPKEEISEERQEGQTYLRNGKK